MTENKRFRLVNELGDYHIKDGDDELCYDLCSPSMAKENWNNVVNRLNEFAEENQRLKDQYERKDRQLQRAKKDVRKYTDYFMNELNWDCDRIIEEVFK